MSPVGHTRSRHGLPLVACAALAVLVGAPVCAAPGPLTKEEQARVDRTIEKAVDFLKRAQTKSGAWPLTDGPVRADTKVPIVLGFSLLPALALLESGVPASDPSVQKVADLVRNNAAKLKDTYEVSLAVLLLDRLGDSKDEGLIRDLGLRLVAFQGYSGGWGYSCPTLSKKNRDDLWQALRELPEEEEGPTRSAGREAPGRKAPQALRVLAIFQPPAKLLRPTEPVDLQQVLYVGTTDNSNTQFALLALWAARRHGVPVARTLRLAARRFEQSQRPDGTWDYHYPTGGFGGRAGRGTRAMTAVGLLALALRHGVDERPGPRPPAVDRRILAGLAALSREVAVPTGQMERRVPLPGFYFLWSVERVGVLYDLPTLADRDWYRWGAEALVTNQTERGDWCASTDLRDLDPGAIACVRAAFALLFLKRSNLAPDLTAKLPFKPVELNKGVLAIRTGGAPVGVTSPGGIGTGP
jgi:hypothetical protein